MPFAFVFRCFLLFGFVLSSHKGRVADEEGQEGTFGNKQMRCSREQRSTIWQYFQFNSPHNCIVACEQAHSFGGCRNTELFTFCFALGSISAALSCLVYPSRCSQTLSQSYHYPPSLCHLEHMERLGHHVQVYWAHILCPAAYHLKVRSLEREVQCPKKNIGSCNRHIALCTATYIPSIKIALKYTNVAC